MMKRVKSTPGSDKLKRRKYDSEDSKRRLLRAAILIFSKNGYDAATTRQIAKAAGLNDSLIHRYFKNKLGLFMEILREFYRHSTETSSYPAGETLAEELTNFVQFRMAFFHRERKFLKMGIVRAILDKKVREEMKVLARTTPGLVSRLEKLRTDGKIRRDVNLEDLSLMVGGLTFSMGMFTDVMEYLDPEPAKKSLSLAVQIITAGLKP